LKHLQLSQHWGKIIERVSLHRLIGRQLGIALFALLINLQPGHCQDAELKVEVKASTGVFTFDENLSYNNSQSFGLGAGYNFREFLQLNLSFSFTPAQQHITQAASVQTANYKIYHSSVNMRISTPSAFLSLKPYIMFGAGGLVINPSAVTLDLGLGNSRTIEPPIDKKFSGNIAIGFLKQITQRIAADLKAQKYFFNLPDTKLASNNFLGIGIIWMF